MKAVALVVSAVLVLVVAAVGLFVPVVAAGAAAVACTAQTPGLNAPGAQGDRGNAEYIWAALLDDGVTPEAAAGVLGNLHQETGGTFDPRTVQSNGVGHGIAQWSAGAGNRWEALVAWAQRSGRDESSLQTQVMWMLKEMHQGWGSFSMARYTTMTDVVEATIYFHDRFEGSADSDEFVRAGRGGLAQDWYSRLRGAVTAPLTPATGSVWVVGDSLTVGSGPHVKELYQQRGRDVTVVAQRNWRTADAVARVDQPAARQATTWVVALGTNDGAQQLRESGRALLRKAGDRRVVWINVVRPEGQDRINAALSQLAEEHAGMRVADFAALAAARPDSFVADGVHMSASGYRWRAQLYVAGADPGTESFDPADCVGGSGGVMTCPTAPERVLPASVRSHMQPNAWAVADCVAAGWPEIDVIGGWRPDDPYPDHPSGQAVDIMMPQGCADTDGRRELGGEIAAFLVKYADEYRIKYLIWRQRIWTIQEGPKPWTEWRGMGDRGSCTANHEDHVHVSTDQVGGDRSLGGFSYDYQTPDDGTRPCPPRVECGSPSAGGSWVLPTKSSDWRAERRNPGNDPGDQRGAPNDHGRCHAGWDIAAPTGQRIVAPAAGRASTGYEGGGAGNYVTLDHGGGVSSLYMHMTRFADEVDGRQVRAGQVIGYVGSTGGSTGPHLHFEVRVDGVAKDPRHWVLAGSALVDAC